MRGIDMPITGLGFNDSNGDFVRISTSNPLPVAGGSAKDDTVAYADGSYATNVATLEKHFYDDFGVDGSTLDPALWQTVYSSGFTVAVSGGAGTITGPVGSGEFFAIGKQDVTLPSNFSTIIKIASKTNFGTTQFARVGLIAVDAVTNLPVMPAGVTTDATSGLPNAQLSTITYANMAAFNFSSTATTGCIIETSSKNINKQVATTTGWNGITTSSEYYLECSGDEINGSSSALDSNAARSTPGNSRQNSVIPNPNLKYRPFIWLKAVSAAAAMVVTLNRVMVQDYRELHVELSGGRSNTAVSQAIGVALVSSPTLSTQVLASSATNSLTPASNLSASGTNATTLKSGGGRLMGGSLTNTTASWKYIKFINATSGFVVGSATVVYQIAIPPNSTISVSDAVGPFGLYFSTAISFGITGGSALLDATAVAVGDVIYSFLYI